MIISLRFRSFSFVFFLVSFLNIQVVSEAARSTQDTSSVTDLYGILSEVKHKTHLGMHPWALQLLPQLEKTYKLLETKTSAKTIQRALFALAGDIAKLQDQYSDPTLDAVAYWIARYKPNASSRRRKKHALIAAVALVAAGVAGAGFVVARRSSKNAAKVPVGGMPAVQAAGEVAVVAGGVIAEAAAEQRIVEEERRDEEEVRQIAAEEAVPEAVVDQAGGLPVVPAAGGVAVVAGGAIPEEARRIVGAARTVRVQLPTPRVISRAIVITRIAAARRRAEEEAAARRRAKKEAAEIRRALAIRRAAEEERRADQEVAARRAAEEEAAARRAAEEEAAAKRRAEEEAAARRRADAEAAAKRRADAEAAAKRRAEEEAAAKRRAEEEAAAKRRAEEEAAARRRAEEEAAARRRAEEEAAAKRRAEEEAAAKRRAEEEAAAKRRAEEEAAAKRFVDAMQAIKKRARVIDKKAPPRVATVASSRGPAGAGGPLARYGSLQSFVGVGRTRIVPVGKAHVLPLSSDVLVGGFFNSPVRVVMPIPGDAILRDLPDIINTTFNKKLFEMKFNNREVFRTVDSYSRNVLHYAAIFPESQLFNDVRLGGALARFLSDVDSRLDTHDNLGLSYWHYAVWADNLSFIRDRSQNLRSLFMVDSLGRTPFHYAVQLGFQDIINFYIQRKSDELWKCDDQGLAAFHYALATENIDVALKLIDLIPESGETNYKKYLWHYVLGLPGTRNNRWLISALYDKKIPSSFGDSHGCTPLMYAAWYGSASGVEVLLSPSNAAYCCELGMNFWHYLALGGIINNKDVDVESVCTPDLCFTPDTEGFTAFDYCLRTMYCGPINAPRAQKMPLHRKAFELYTYLFSKNPLAALESKLDNHIKIATAYPDFAQLLDWFKNYRSNEGKSLPQLAFEKCQTLVNDAEKKAKLMSLCTVFEAARFDLSGLDMFMMDDDRRADVDPARALSLREHERLGGKLSVEPSSLAETLFVSRQQVWRIFVTSLKIDTLSEDSLEKLLLQRYDAMVTSNLSPSVAPLEAYIKTNPADLFGLWQGWIIFNLICEMQDTELLDACKTIITKDDFLWEVKDHILGKELFIPQAERLLFMSNVVRHGLISDVKTLFTQAIQSQGFDSAELLIPYVNDFGPVASETDKYSLLMHWMNKSDLHSGTLNSDGFYALLIKSQEVINYIANMDFSALRLSLVRTDIGQENAFRALLLMGARVDLPGSGGGTILEYLIAKKDTQPNKVFCRILSGFYKRNSSSFDIAQLGAFTEKELAAEIAVQETLLAKLNTMRAAYASVSGPASAAGAGAASGEAAGAVRDIVREYDRIREAAERARRAHL